MFGGFGTTELIIIMVLFGIPAIVILIIVRSVLKKNKDQNSQKH